MKPVPWILSLEVAVSVAACGSTTEPPKPDIILVTGGASWPEADALFHQDPRWLGGDGALSINLGGDRLLWLFGDTFVATSDAHVRTESEMVRNTIAIMTGRDPTTATMAFTWRTDPDGSPAPFFADVADEWHWPGHGVRLGEGGPLLIFLAAVRPSSDGLGFTEAGYRVVRVANPDEDPLTWTLEWIEPPAPAFDPDVMVGTAVLSDAFDVFALTSGNHAAHTGWLVRWPLADAAAGDLSHPEWWTGATWAPQESLSAAAPPRPILADAGPECSFYMDWRLGRHLHVRSDGFGATTIVLDAAATLAGPFSATVEAFTPPESLGANPFVYAAKAHHELIGPTPESTVVTYATNSFTFADLFTPEGANLYYPRFATFRVDRF